MRRSWCLLTARKKWAPAPFGAQPANQAKLSATTESPWHEHIHNTVKPKLGFWQKPVQHKTPTMSVEAREEEPFQSKLRTVLSPTASRKPPLTPFPQQTLDQLPPFIHLCCTSSAAISSILSNTPYSIAAGQQLTFQQHGR